MKTQFLLFLISSLLLTFSSGERCGRQAGGAFCPNGLCCSQFGWCGDTEAYCKPPNCQLQCKQCGRQVGGALCPNGLCCSEFGFCGDTEPYCKQPGCQSQCTPPGLYASHEIVNGTVEQCVNACSTSCTKESMKLKLPK